MTLQRFYITKRGCKVFFDVVIRPRESGDANLRVPPGHLAVALDAHRLWHGNRYGVSSGWGDFGGESDTFRGGDDDSTWRLVTPDDMTPAQKKRAVKLLVEARNAGY